MENDLSYVLVHTYILYNIYTVDTHLDNLLILSLLTTEIKGEFQEETFFNLIFSSK